MQKRITALIIALIVFMTSVILVGTVTVSAVGVDSFALMAKGTALVRSSASASADIVYTLEDKKCITALKNVVNGWYQVEYESGKSGYVISSSVSAVSGSCAAAVNISSGVLNVRSGEGTSYDKVGSLAKGAYFVVLSSANNWSKILFNGVSVGYVSNDYVLRFNINTVPDETVSKVAEKFVSIALAEEGYREGADNYSKYGAYFNNPNSAWCDAFVLWCANMTDKSLYGTAFPTFRGCTTIMNWYKGKNQFVSKNSGYIPKTGDLVFYNTADSSTTSSTHIGIVTGYSDGYYTSIEGNYSDKVSTRRVAVTHSTVLGFVTPDFSYAKNLIASFDTTSVTTTKPTTTTTTKTTTTTTKTTTKTTTTPKPTTTTTSKPVVVTRVSKTIPADMLSYSNGSPQAVYAAPSYDDTQAEIGEVVSYEIPTASSTTVTTASQAVTTYTDISKKSFENNVCETINSLGVVDAPALNVRADADMSAEKIYVLSNGSPLKVLKKTGDWCEVLLPNGLTGYVSNCFVAY